MLEGTSAAKIQTESGLKEFQWITLIALSKKVIRYSESVKVPTLTSELPPPPPTTVIPAKMSYESFKIEIMKTLGQTNSLIKSRASIQCNDFLIVFQAFPGFSFAKIKEGHLFSRFAKFDVYEMKCWLSMMNKQGASSASDPWLGTNA